MNSSFQVPKLDNAISQTSREELALAGEFHSTTDGNLLALISIEGVKFLPSGGLAEYDLTVVGTEGCDHVVVRPCDRVYLDIGVLMLE